jgi:hypothetical protein
MIIVSGEPRTGTTMMMNIVRALCFTIQFDHAETLEIKRVARNGMSMKMFLGRMPHLCPKIIADCVKLVSTGLTSTDPQLVDKVIYMTRNLYDTTMSQYRSGYTGDRVEEYVSNTIAFMKWSFETGKNRVLIVDYDSVVKSPEYEIARVCSFLDGNPKLINEAAELVQQKGD